jgi:hypothetical protein
MNGDVVVDKGMKQISWNQANPAKTNLPLAQHASIMVRSHLKSIVYIYPWH